MTTLAARDLKCIWHPCTQMKDHETIPLIPIKSGEGVWLHGFDGERYLDAISSWWVNIFGHANPYIGNKVKAQVDTLEHAIFAGFTHEPIVELSERLVAKTPAGLSRCFYADNGSSAVEVALKMSFQFWQNQGKPSKQKFVSLSNSYHGETLGALAVGDVGLYKDTFDPLLLQPIIAPSPDSFNRAPGQSWQEYALEQADKLRAIFEDRNHEIAAIIIEPLVQCAGNMRMYHPAYLTAVRALCDEFDVHLIADEIAVGFGRTGTLFACEQGKISPDFMCLSKGLTGGYLPLSVVLTHEHVYEAFYTDYSEMKAFLHSHSYTGNPIACSAALATLDLFEQRDVIADNNTLSQTTMNCIAELHDHPHVIDIRQTGMITAIEIGQKNGTPYDWRERRGVKVFEYGLSQGVLLRPLGNVIYFIPPYVINEAEIKLMTKTAVDGIHKVTSE